MQVMTSKILTSVFSKTILEIRNVTLYNLYNSSSVQKRYKHKNSKRNKDNESYDEIDETEDYELEPGVKLINISVPSLRTDLILKTGLGISRNKIEVAFYEGKIRKNGEKVKKKSDSVNIGDEIDLYSNKTHANTNLSTVSRIKLIDATLEDDSYKIKITRDKNLLIESEKPHF